MDENHSKLLFFSLQVWLIIILEHFCWKIYAHRKDLCRLGVLGQAWLWRLLWLQSVTNSVDNTNGINDANSIDDVFTLDIKINLSVTTRWHSMKMLEYCRNWRWILQVFFSSRLIIAIDENLALTSAPWVNANSKYRKQYRPAQYRSCWRCNIILTWRSL